MPYELHQWLKEGQAIAQIFHQMEDIEEKNRTVLIKSGRLATVSTMQHVGSLSNFQFC